MSQLGPTTSPRCRLWSRSVVRCEQPIYLSVLQCEQIEVLSATCHICLHLSADMLFMGCACNL